MQKCPAGAVKLFASTFEGWLASRSAKRGGWSQLSGSGCFAGLALHSETAPNEEVANKIRTAFTRENMPRSHVEFKRILQLFFVIRHYSFGVHFGVQNGVHIRMTGKNSGSF